MKENNRSKGFYYEEQAAAFLQKLGYTIVEQNYICPAGEVDIIARDGAELVFVEVKYRRSLGYGSGFDAVDPQKQKRLSKCLLYYLMSHKLADVASRFDVISIHNREISLVKNAFNYWGS